MDRNTNFDPVSLFDLVALRKESVDRNIKFVNLRVLDGSSLSARRAWIEMLPPMYPLRYGIVALRKESVDRNLYYGDDLTFSDGVALRKESVDRNLAWHCISEDVSCRSPQGERG